MINFLKSRGGPALFILLSVSGWAPADVIVLRNGNEIQGEIIEENDRRLTVRFTGGTLYLDRRDVVSVRRETKIQYLLSEGETMLRRSPQEAIGIFQKALDTEPGSEEAKKGLLKAQEKHGAELAEAHRYLEAAGVYQTLLERVPDHAAAAAALQKINATLRELGAEEARGLQALGRGDVDEALPRLRKVYEHLLERRAALGPALARALIQKGDGLLSAGQLEAAEASYLEAVSIDPDLVPAMSTQFSLARARRVSPLAERGDWKGLLAAAQEGLRIVPQSEVLAYLEALSLQGLGRLREAAEAYLKISGLERPRDLVKSLDQLRAAAEARVQVAIRGEAPPPPDSRREEVLAGDFRELETEHFLIRHRNATIAAEVSESAEESYHDLYREIDCTSQWLKRCTITLYPTQEEFQEASGQQAWTGGAHQISRRLGGLADHRISSYQNQPRLAGAVIPHEVAHAMLAFRVGYVHEIPLWVNEGFAIHHEPDYVHRYYSRITADAVRSRMMIPISKLVNIETYPTRDEEVKLFYAESYSLVDLLLEERKMSVLIEFISELAGSPGGLERLLAKHYRIASLKALEARWASRVGGS